MDSDPKKEQERIARQAHIDAAAKLLGSMEALDEVRGYLESSMGHAHIASVGGNSDHVLQFAEELLEQAKVEQKLSVDLSHLDPPDIITVTKAVLLA